MFNRIDNCFVCTSKGIASKITAKIINWVKSKT